MSFCNKCGTEFSGDGILCERCASFTNGKTTSNQPRKMQVDRGGRRQIYEGEIRKCPNCGDPIDALEFICDKCGFNFSTNRMSSSQERLSASLAAIDAKLQGWEDNGQEFAIQLKEQKASCINAFPVANSVEEIVSFMIYASGNIDMNCINADRRDAYDIGDRKIAEAWIGKMDQMYQMAKVSFPDSPKFSQIESIYIEKKDAIKKKKTGDDLLITLLIVIAAIIVGGIFLYILGSATGLFGD